MINHPSCNLTTSQHSVFFTESPDEDTLQRASSAVFYSWYTENPTLNSGGTLSCSKELNSRNLCELVEHDNFAQITPREMRARKRGKPLLSVNQSERQGGPTTTSHDQSENSIQSVEIEPPMLGLDQTECQRTLTHPLHTISTGPAPLPIEQ